MMRYTNRSISSNSSYNSPSYSTANGCAINQKDQVKDLGITMSNDCTFSEHIQEVIKSMRAKSSWITRTFSCRSKYAMLTLWKSLVIPLHDYCSQLWNPVKLNDIAKFEQVQWSFIRKVSGVAADYWSALSQFQLLSLQRRRERYMIFYVWKVLEGAAPSLVKSDGTDLMANNWTLRRGRFCTVDTVSTRLSPVLQTIKRNSFTVHGASLFNVLPKYIRDISGCGFEVFKNAVDTFLMNVPDEPHYNGYSSRFRTGGELSNSLLSMVKL